MYDNVTDHWYDLRRLQDSKTVGYKTVVEIIMYFSVVLVMEELCAMYLFFITQTLLLSGTF